ncbi:MAG: hypothetical protein Q9171_002790 [Xanthocarpia ochracea]
MANKDTIEIDSAINSQPHVPLRFRDFFVFPSHGRHENMVDFAMSDRQIFQNIASSATCTQRAWKEESRMSKECVQSTKRDDPFALLVLVHLRRVCSTELSGRFDHELTNTIFAQTLASIRRGNIHVAHIFALVKRNIVGRAAAGTLDESGLKSAIISVGHSLQNEHAVLRVLDQNAIFSIFFDVAVDYLGPDEAVSNLFKLGTPVFDPKQTKMHTMVIAAYIGETEVVQSLLSKALIQTTSAFSSTLRYPQQGDVAVPVL